MNNLFKANDFYSKIVSEIDIRERRDLIRYTWGLILIPLVEERETKLHLVESLEQVPNFYKIEQEPDVLQYYYDYKHIKWFDYEEGTNIIKRVPFFRGFTDAEFDSKISPFFILKKLDKNHVIFTRKREVSVVIQGDIILKSHAVKLIPSKSLARYTKGDIIGFTENEEAANQDDNW